MNVFKFKAGSTGIGINQIINVLILKNLPKFFETMRYNRYTIFIFIFFELF